MSRLLLLAVLFASCAFPGTTDGDEYGGISHGRFALGTLIDVLKAKTAMLEYLTEENCTMDPNLRSSLGLSVGNQFLLTVASNSSKYGLVTIHSDYEDGSDNDDIRMRLSGRQRFDTSDSFDANVSVWTAVQGQTDSWLNSNDQLGEFKLESSSTQTDMVILAPHGGLIENYTDELAVRLYNGLVSTNGKDASLWYCAGYQGAIGAYDAWHVTSTDISEANFGYLNDLSGRSYSNAVSVHGHGGSEVLVGGGAPTSFKESVKDALDALSWSYTVTVVGAGDEMGGVSPDNIVNRYSSNGVQLELPYGARRDYWEDVADALVDFYDSLL